MRLGQVLMSAACNPLIASSGKLGTPMLCKWSRSSKPLTRASPSLRDTQSHPLSHPRTPSIPRRSEYYMFHLHTLVLLFARTCRCHAICVMLNSLLFSSAQPPLAASCATLSIHAVRHNLSPSPDDYFTAPSDPINVNTHV